ncbi:ATP-dependent DNA helicase Snf21 [Schizosaccharomyces cryophilus OY26]|uniref:ATP-dependent DNA helicase Snf21 n=1 Tax=Schizosaccharomyces cryophilus (strain OY26 / ATCC MYA-4695 / CBS 11777 / NBRC 106824 / NRRL Y48691) TaxID=653667 RepID=S9VQL6_SCHCR|nr:ATP-dependent DNA helicase Snf21 [Schizosaccharomyces cryophilus OY26]EPY50243.1 ATP-dependent DNA helicase Snf21 [Schizosaccharomyces cryophilus OY26]
MAFVEKEYSKSDTEELLGKWRKLRETGATERNNLAFAQVCDELRNVQRNIEAKKKAKALLKQYACSINEELEKKILKEMVKTYRHLSLNLPVSGNEVFKVLLDEEKKTRTEDVSDLEDSVPTNLSQVQKSDLIFGETEYLQPLSYRHIIQAHNEKVQDEAIHIRLTKRIHELESMSAAIEDIPSLHFFGEDQKSQHVHSTKRNALLELKMLRLAKRQEALHAQIRHCKPYTRVLLNTADRIACKLPKPAPQATRLTEALERQQRSDRERRQKQRQYDYLQNICSHGRELAARTKNAQARAQKANRAVLAYHSHIEKEEQRRAERNAKQRLQALREDDEEAYLKLIDQAKDTRITHLLRQTDHYLDSLANAVKAQQSQTGDTTYDEDFDRSLTGEAETKVDYYNVAHNIQEVITDQPSILVGGKLKEYQLRGLQWMISLYNNHLNGILADEMGLGKTIQTISLVTHLIEKKRQNGPFLIIVPLSTLTNWAMEFERWAPSISKIVYKGPPLVRKALQPQVRHSNFQVLLTTFEYVIKDRPVLSRIKWIYMIMDEGHRMKNTQSKLTSTLTTYYSSRYRLILTGTPLQNNLPELWALLNFVLPKIFNSVKSFDEWFNTPFANTGNQDKVELTEEESLLVIRRLHKVLRPFLLRRLKKDVESELPDKVEKVIRCQMSGLQQKLYHQMKKHGILFVEDANKGRAGIKGLQNTVMQLKKICNHPYVFEDVERSIDPTGLNYDMLWRVSGKFELLDRVLPKLFRVGHRVLMFFQMTQIMNIMEDYLHYRHFRYLRLDGSTKADDRSKLLGVFNDPTAEINIFLLSTRAGGLGLNLQSADTVIIFDSDWNPHQDLQAQDRAHRIGQTKEVRIYRLITEKSVEENILSRAQYKLDIDGKVIQAGKFDNKSTPEEREAFLRSLLENENGEEHNDEKGELDDDELNELLARSDQELEIYRNMTKEEEENSPYGKGKEKDRLIQVEELPEFYQQEQPVEAEEEQQHIEELGRGARRRVPVVYDETVRDAQWLTEMEMEPEVKPTRGRPKRNSSAVEEPIPLGMDGKPKRKRGPAPDTLSTEHRSLLRRICLEIYNAAYELKDEHGRPINSMFLEVPSKKLYPDYYLIIKTPIALDSIRKHINGTYYKSLDAMVSDFMTMFNNARTYNEEGSFVYEDANRMQAAMEQKIQELEENGTLTTLRGMDFEAIAQQEDRLENEA